MNRNIFLIFSALSATLRYVFYDFQHNANRFRRIVCAVDDDAVGFVFGDELVQVFVKMFDHVRADAMRALTPFAPVGNRFKRSGAPFQAALGVGI